MALGEVPWDRELGQGPRRCPQFSLARPLWKPAGAVRGGGLHPAAGQPPPSSQLGPLPDTLGIPFVSKGMKCWYRLS